MSWLLMATPTLLIVATMGLERIETGLARAPARVSEVAGLPGAALRRERA